MEEGNWYASTLARGLSLIEAFGHDAVWLGNAELARRTGLSKPTVSRLSATLVELGYLNRGEGGKVQLGARLLALSYPVLRGLPIRQLARPLMMEVARDIRGAVSIGIASRLSAIMIETARTMEPHPRSPDIGNHAPLIQSAMGRALLAQFDAARLEQVLKQSSVEFPALWELHQAKTMQAIADCVRQGYCVAYGDYHPNIHAVGVPLLTLPNGAVLSMNCGIQPFRLAPNQFVDEIAPKLVALAASICELWKAADSRAA